MYKLFLYDLLLNSGLLKLQQKSSYIYTKTERLRLSITSITIQPDKSTNSLKMSLYLSIIIFLFNKKSL